MTDIKNCTISVENENENVNVTGSGSGSGSKYKWYALYTSPRAEKRVKEKIDQSGIECYLPLHRSPRVWSDRIKIVDVPLFNSYIFVKCREREIFYLNKINGVVKTIFYNGKPAVIRQSEIDAIKMFIEEAAGKALCTGDEVEILTGMMKNISGKIVKIKKKYLVLHIKQLMATVCVNTESVAPLNRIK
ncbi:MAG: UpxY family transcription antiterminator [Tannerella sp.]|jgi:transcription antitermination factor NusG|nr:UpxY family transcription antiterminator [Tannerella sp.]